MRQRITNVFLVACAIGVGAGCKDDSGNAQLNKQTNARGTTSSQPLGPDPTPTSAPKLDQPGSSAAERGTPTNARTAAVTTDDRGVTEGSATGSMGSASAAIATVAKDPALLLQTLHKDGKAEIEAGKLAEKKGQSKAVKQLGADLIRDHQQADQMLMAYAKKHDIELTVSAKTPAMREQTTGTTTNPTPPSASTPAGLMDPMAMVQQLKNVPAQQFDAQFGQMMAMGHRQTIDLVTSARSSAQDEELKSLLGEILPKLQEHLQMAQTIAGADHASGQPQGRRGSPH